jgi:hypothetical protein
LGHNTAEGMPFELTLPADGLSRLLSTVHAELLREAIEFGTVLK